MTVGQLVRRSTAGGFDTTLSDYTLVNVTGVTVNFQNKQQELHLRTYTPLINIPRTMKHYFMDIEHYTMTLAGKGVAPGVAATDLQNFTSNTIVYPTVPDMLVIFLRRSIDLNSYNQADAFASITRLSINVTGVDSGMLGSASQYQLWQMSVRNGSKQTWQQFSNDQGSVIFVNIAGGDLGGLVAGVNEPFRITVGGSFLKYNIFWF